MSFTALPQIEDGFEGLLRGGEKIRKRGERRQKRKPRDGSSDCNPEPF